MGSNVNAGVALKKDAKWFAAWVCLILALTALPYLYAWVTTPAGMKFGGLLSNPLDGNTYLAKMAQGAAGHWLFGLPYTSEPHPAGFLNPYFLLLGHVADWLGVSLPLMFHLARLMNGALCLVVGYFLAAWLFTDQYTRRLAWLFIFLASGLGWLFALFGHLTPDLLVPEAIPFYSIYTNPHFPLGLSGLMALLVLILAPLDGSTARRPGIWTSAGAALAAVIIALTQAFLFLVAGIVIVVVLGLRWQRNRHFPMSEVCRCALAAAVALPIVIPQILTLTTEPAFRAHAAQDVNLSPPLWDYGISFAVLLPLAVVGAIHAGRRRSEADLFLLVWAVVNLLLAYAPLSIQRRLIMGAQVPLALLAAAGFAQVTRGLRSVGAVNRLRAGLLALSVLTNLLLLGLGVSAATRRDVWIYLLPGESEALSWLKTQPAHGAVVALPRTAMFIPGWTGQRVYYGHPMETLDAQRKRMEVETLYTQSWGADHPPPILLRSDVSWLWVGPYERQFMPASTLQLLESWEPAYDRAGVTIYLTRHWRTPASP